MNPILKNGNKKVKKSNFFSSVKDFFFPTPEMLVDKMSTSTSYPYGRSLDEISNKIVSSKTLAPEQKIDLLFDAYGKYYKYQHERVVNFAAFEFYYEDFMIEFAGELYKHQYRYDKRFRELSAETKYIVNRNFDEDMKDVFAEASQKNILHSVLEKLDDYEIESINAAMKLKDNYEEGLVDNEYQADDNEKRLEKLLVARYDKKLEQQKASTKPFPEFEEQVITETPSQSSQAL